MEWTGLAVGLCVGGLLVVCLLLWWRTRWQAQVKRWQAEAEQLLRDAREERERVLRAAEVEGKAALLAMQQEHEREVKQQRDALAATEKRLRQKEEVLERKHDGLERRERELHKRLNSLEGAEQRARKTLEEAERRVAGACVEMERVSGLTQEEARRELLASLEAEARRVASKQVKKVEEEARAEAHERATKIIAEAMARLAGGFVAEKAVSVVELPSDEMKGRIIGREGRNIRALEAKTGVDVIIDDTPEVVVVSGFNPVRREVAKMALERLIDDGRIHPARIEEVVDQCAADMDEVTINGRSQWRVLHE